MLASAQCEHPVAELLLWPPGSWPPPARAAPEAASAQAFGLLLAEEHDPGEIWQPLEHLLAGPKPCCLAFELHPHGEPPMPNNAPAELLALQSPSYGPLGPKEHRAVWLDPAIAWQQWRANAVANTALHAHHSPGLVVLHAFHLELVEPILHRLQALLGSEAWPIDSTELFVTAPPQHLAALQQRLAALPIACQLLPSANYGRHLFPFLQLLPDLLARRCELVLKLHTKRSDHVQSGALTRVADGTALQQRLAAALERLLGLIVPG